MEKREDPYNHLVIIEISKTLAIAKNKKTLPPAMCKDTSNRFDFQVSGLLFPLELAKEKKVMMDFGSPRLSTYGGYHWHLIHAIGRSKTPKPYCSVQDGHLS